MNASPFRYNDARWRRLEEIVERAGGADTRDKFNAERLAFESLVRGWQSRMGKWNGFAFGKDKDGDRFEAVEKAARELKAALDDLNFPTVFADNDLVWKRLDGTEENWKAEKERNWQRYRKFLDALNHIRMRSSALKTKPRRKQARLARDKFFRDLGHVWRVELGLRITASVKSPFVAFVEAASKGVYRFGNDDTARDEILNVVRSWPRGSECKNRGEET